MDAILVQKRGRILGSLTKAATFVDNLQEHTSIEEIESRLSKLESWWEEFYNIEDELLLSPQQTSKSEEFEAKFFTTQASMAREIKKRKPIGNTNNEDLNATINNMYSQQRAYLESLHNKSIGPSNEVKLPRINIPPFNGEYTQWPSFKDMFEATVHHNESISRVHKFQLLKGLLQGSAARLINHFLITEASYKEAWDKLKQRYDKKRTIVSTIIKTFLDQPAIHHASPKLLRNLTETSDELLRGLKALGPDCESRDPWILHLLLNKMDDETKQQWALHSVEMDAPSVDNFIKFLHQRCDALESCNINMKPSRSVPNASHIVTTKVECTMCNKAHPLHKCYKFQRSDVEFRKAFTKKHNLCTNCLRKGHSTINCQSQNTCFKCKEKHHTILHDGDSSVEQTTMNANITLNQKADSKSTNPSSSTSSDSQSYTSTNTTICGTQQAILPTVVISCWDIQGTAYNVRALLDSGSESSFITESLTRKLGLKRRHAYITVNGLASVSAGRTKGQVSIKLSSRYDANQFLMVNALVLDKLTNCLPSQAAVLQSNDMRKLQEFRLADPEFYKPNQIDMILGINVFYDIVRERRISLQPKLYLLDSLFGWVVAGCAEQKTNSATKCYTITINNEDVCQLLRQFWEVEEITPATFSNDDESEKHFLNSHRFVNGRYMVELPLKDNFNDLGSNIKAATSRMIAMERKFVKDENLRDEYIRFMREYEELGHMSRIPDQQLFADSSKMYYLPHHAVIKQSGESRKLRVVFDGSCKSNTGLSLNDVLETGPTIQEDLFSILTRFRRHKIALVSDVEKMYRQINVHPKHQDFQRIVWRENPDDAMQHFKLQTVTYGLTCSAYLAIRSLHQVAMDSAEISPELSRTIKSDFYVDDLLTGRDSVEEAFAFYKDISTTLMRAGFPLRQWSSNSQELLDSIPREKQGKDSILFENPESCIKTLGICWLTNEDAFTFCVPELGSNQLTKRRLLSECGKIFDPLGWLSPATIVLKILLQSLWLKKLEWDDPLPEDISNTWCSIKTEFSLFSGIRIPRFLHMQDLHDVQYHGFCDASEKAYSAVVYARSTSNKGDIYMHLIAAKTKVSPLKQISIPRLELCGAVLLTKLLCKVAEIFEAPQDLLHAWTDSNVVLAWLSDVPRKWNCFVANRSSYIIDKLPKTRWQHVPSKLNPADCASRGLTPGELSKCAIWWNGPEYLQLTESSWPNHNTTPVEFTDCERKKVALITTNDDSAIKSTSLLQQIMENHSSYMMILRILSCCIRFAEICLKERTTYITCEHLRKSENVLIKWAQRDSFHEEIHHLENDIPINKSSKLRSLHPFLDPDGILRVGGRIQNSEVGYLTKHPAILPKQHQLTDKLVRYLHLKHLHPNPSMLLFIARSKYWIIGAKEVIKKISNSCLNCIRSHPKLEKQIMGNLPKPRVTLIRAFANVGIDYAGPIVISSKAGRGSKRLKTYVCLFVCMATKAIHVEVVHDLSTDAFIASLKRFTGRRGLPQAIYSDNATNFVGARRRFDEFFATIASKAHNDKVNAFLATHQIEWHTIPPSAPHFGGLWEAGVKSVKTHIRRVLGETAPTYDELQTLLIQIEAIVNSRPLTPITDDPNDLNILTPGHFLIGSSILEVPDKCSDDITLKLTGRWELLQNLARGFWKRWHLEYLSMLQKRSKWQHQQQNFKVGELALIKEENTSPLVWPRGRVIELHPGTDGSVRVVTLKTGNGELKRPIAKLCKIPLE